MYISKFSIVDFSPAQNLESKTDLPKKRGRPPKNSPHANKSMFIKSTETMPMRYELTSRMTDQFKKDKRRRREKKACASPTTTNTSNSSSSGTSTLIEESNNRLVSETLVSTHTSNTCVPQNTTTTTSIDSINTQQLTSNDITTTTNIKPTERKIRYSISIREILN